MGFKIGAFAFGLIGVAAVAYGAFGTIVILGDWFDCQSVAMAALASLPDCRTIPWLRQFGVGAGLIIVGVALITVAWWCVRRARGARHIDQH